jgi:hypothetical protein
MRGRRGSVLGASPNPNSWGSFSGLWRASEIYTARVGFSWPTKSLAVSIWPSSVNATSTGDATFFGSVSSGYPSYSSVWQKSIDGGQTWANVSGTENESTLSLTGLTIADDESLYRLYAEAGLRKVFGGPVEVQFDTITVSISSQPSNSFSSVGWWASFFAFASGVGDKYGGSYTATYQWQELISGVWTNLSGKTNSSLFVNVEDATFEGRSYRVIASVGSSTATSDAAMIEF